MIFIVDSTELRTYATVSPSLTKERWLPHQAKALEHDLKPIFGATLLMEISAFKTSSVPIRLELFRLTASALASFILFRYTAVGEVNVSDAGIQREEGENSKTAYAKQVRQLRESLINSAWEEVETMVDYLNANFATLNSWTSAPGYTMNNGLILDNPKDLLSLYHTEHAYRLHRMFRPTLEQIELQLEKHFDVTTMLTLRTTAKGALTEKFLKLRKYIDQVLVAEALIVAITTKSVVWNSDGVKIINRTGDENDVSMAVDAHTAAMSIRSLEKTAKNFLNEAITFVQTDVYFPETIPEAHTSKTFHV